MPFSVHPNVVGIGTFNLESFNQYKEIYFVAHSMGGLVVKSLLVNLNHGDSLALLRQVKAVIYLGTPALGNDRASFREGAREILTVC